jgi:hypothetical protein
MAKARKTEVWEGNDEEIRRPAFSVDDFRLPWKNFGQQDALDLFIVINTAIGQDGQLCENEMGHDHLESRRRVIHTLSTRFMSFSKIRG